MDYRLIKKEELTAYELQTGLLSYEHLFFESDNLILCNSIIEDYEYLTLESGEMEENDEPIDVYQYYIIDSNLAERLKRANEIIYYHEKLDIYILGVTHFGTRWAYVPTDIKLIDNHDGWYRAQIKKPVEVEILDNEG